MGSTDDLRAALGVAVGLTGAARRGADRRSRGLRGVDATRAPTGYRARGWVHDRRRRRLAEVMARAARATPSCLQQCAVASGAPKPDDRQSDGAHPKQRESVAVLADHRADTPPRFEGSRADRGFGCRARRTTS